jgi:predicted lipid-binding transport protein (Tim44 family)
MKISCSKLTVSLLLLVGFALVGGGLAVDSAEARSMKGGRSFQMAPKKVPAQTTRPAPAKEGGSVSRGMMGGLLGGAIGGLLLGSMFGMGGTGMGILPIILLGVAAYFLYRRFAASRQAGYQAAAYSGQPGSAGGGVEGYSGGAGPPATPEIGGNLVADGLEQIRQSDRHFDANHFLEVASDVFFQIQAGWMRRDLDSYRHLLGSELAAQYAEHFAEMRRLGQINKLESIAIRNVEIVAAGSDGREDFVTVQFTANLLDYTVDDQSGEVLDGSVSTPVKFQEQWTWARPVGTEEWKLEGIKEG